MKFLVVIAALISVACASGLYGHGHGAYLGAPIVSHTVGAPLVSHGECCSNSVRPIELFLVSS